MTIEDYRQSLHEALDAAFPDVPIDWNAPSSAETFRIIQSQRRWVYGEVLLSLEELVTVKRSLYDAAFTSLLTFATKA